MAQHLSRFLGLLSLALGACSPPEKAPARNPREEAVRVEPSDPPPGARLVGPIAGSDGPDCALLESRGTEERALAELRKTAAQRGIDFVKVTKVTVPYSDHACVHKRYRIEGLGYVTAAAMSTAVATPMPPAATEPAACTPPCAAGFRCHSGTCEALCDPACGPAQFCRSDRVCAALPSAPSAPSAPAQ